MARQAKLFKRKTTLALRCIVKLTEDGYLVDCIDAGAIGLGESQQDAFVELASCLTTLYETVGEKMKNRAHPTDEEQFIRVTTGQLSSEDHNVVGWGVISRVEISATAAAKKSKIKIPEGASFEMTQLNKAA
ncbi:MAG: hypothetical protein V3V10_06335 [Planctomycetota bacterium]